MKGILIMIEYDKLYEEVKSMLSEKRFNHTQGVIKRAIEYAEIYNVNIEDAKYAALVHDIAKEISLEDSYKMLVEYNVELDDVEKKNFNLVHAKLGAAIAKYKYNLNENIVSAIKYHTTAKEDMTMLEKIIYLADATDGNRKYDSLDELVERIKKDVNDGLLFTIKWNIEKVLEKELCVHMDSIKAYNFLIK